MNLFDIMKWEEHSDEPISLNEDDKVYLGNAGLAYVEVLIKKNCTISGKTLFDSYVKDDWTTLQSFPVEITFHEKPIRLKGWKEHQILYWIVVTLALISIGGIVWTMLRAGGIL